jgi:colanic acid/amylovoran biosynthesis glycosyltransferase
MRSVIIFRDRLLSLSETFIRSQVSNLSRFSGVYAGCRRVPGLELTDNPIVVMANSAMGRAEELMLKATGRCRRLAARLEEYKPVVLHAHFGPDGATALPLARRLRIPLLVTFHGFDANLTDHSFQASRWGRRYLRRRDTLKHQSAGFLAASEFIAGKLLEQNFPEEKIRVHYIGVDTERFQSDEIFRQSMTVLFVGRLVEKKGCEYLIRAMESVQRELPDAKLVVIGSGPLQPQLESEAKLRLRQYRFLGSQSADEVRDWMRKATLLCVPSIVAASGDAEGLPITLMEAQSSGLPVVAFASAGIPEVLLHGENGFLAAEKDHTALSQQIAVLLQDRVLWKKFSIAGRERITKMFDLKRQTAKLETIYEDLVSSHASKARLN